MMRNFISLVLIVLFTFGLLINDAQAKRFGGGRSFGVQRTTSSYSRMQPKQTTSQAAPTNRWLGPLAGLLTGGLLASLLMGNGLGSGILTWLIIGLIVLAILSLVRRKMNISAPLHYNNAQRANPLTNGGSFLPTNDSYSEFYNSAQDMRFDAETFLRDAKVQFIRLQAAYDQKNLNDLRKFTTPEVFAEIQLQLQDRGDQSNQTEVVSLDAKLLDSGMTNASVHFSGSIREGADEPAEPFNEIWHFEAGASNSQWVVAGIQQV